jgi:hypothetical protein
VPALYRRKEMRMERAASGMKIGKKVTILFRAYDRDSNRPPGAFLRCYVIGRVSNGWQLYDPVRDWSWGLRFDQTDRVVVA